MATYTYADLKSTVNSRIHGKAGVIVNIRDAINRGVRKPWGEIDFRSAIRSAALAPNLFNDIYQYGAPSDLKGKGIVDIQPQTGDREGVDNWYHTTEEEFSRKKTTERPMIAIASKDLTKKLLIAADMDNKALILAALDSLTGDGGTWVLFGDGTNVRVDNDDFIKGSGSVRWDISAAGGTTAGIQDLTLNTNDITDYKSAGSVFVWQKITSITGLTNFKLRLYSSSLNYYEITATTTHEGEAFAVGWNLLRFDMANRSTTGTPVDTAISRAALYMTKLGSKISEVDYRTDHLIIQRGTIWNTKYYSRYPWQTSGGTYIANSTANTDYINVEDDEYNIIIESCVHEAALDAREADDVKSSFAEYGRLKAQYEEDNPSEALPLVTSIFDF